MSTNDPTPRPGGDPESPVSHPVPSGTVPPAAGPVPGIPTAGVSGLLARRAWVRWAAPLAVLTAVGGGLVVYTAQAEAEPTLPLRSAAQLLVDLQTARLDGLSGTVVTRADLGLPELPSTIAEQGGPASLLSGSHTLRLWYAGPERVRIALMDTTAEVDVIRDGRDLWTWTSRTKQVGHLRLPADLADHARPEPTRSLTAFTPQQAADAALRAVEPTTRVSVDGTAKVAGRAAYELVLQPRTEETLVDQVRIAVDAERHLPLRVQVFPVDAKEPALESRYTQVSFTRPGADRFRFAPPPGATVTEKSLGDLSEDLPDGVPGLAGGLPQVRVDGEGWASVLVVTLPKALRPGTDKGPGATADGMVQMLPKVEGSWGSGRLLSGRLASVLVTDDGRVLLGPVPGERLVRVAGGTDPAAATEPSGTTRRSDTEADR